MLKTKFILKEFKMKEDLISKINSLSQHIKDNNPDKANLLPLDNLEAIYKMWIFTCLNGEFGVEYPDGIDEVMGYYKNRQEAEKALINWIDTNIRHD